MLNDAVFGWGKAVPNLFKSGCKTMELLAARVVYSTTHVDKKGCLYKSLGGFVPLSFHRFFELFRSVGPRFLQAFHTTYNNKVLDLFKFNYYLGGCL